MGQPLVSESPPLATTDPAAWQPAPDITPIAPAEPAAPAISADAAAAIAKADGGDRESMYEMSFRYQDGSGVPADNATAISWLTRAAEAGHAEAMNDLAYRYAKGEGVAESGEWAAHWFGKGAEAGSGMAMFNFAVCHAQGIGVPQNDYAARIWIMRSAESGYEPAQTAVKQMQAELLANAFGAVLEGMFGGGDDGGGDTSAKDADREYWNARRQSQQYWEDRARQAAANGNESDYNYSRSMIP
jgi:TPR repeat protein